MLLFAELLQVALNTRSELSRVPTGDEWEELLNEAQRQTIVGSLLSGIERLPSAQHPPKRILVQWIGLTQMIESRCSILNARCIEIQNLFRNGGFKTCILKGQGNALMYPNPLRRMSGDIDLWVDGERESIAKFVKTIAPSAKAKYKDIEFHYKDVEVEAHFFPAYLNNFHYNRRLQHFVSNHQEEQFRHLAKINDEYLCVPTDDFNVIYQMTHLYHHFFCEGIGMRHFVDYYYLLTKLDGRTKNVNFSRYGMQRFAEGVMWIEKEVLGLHNSFLVAKPNEKVGKVLMSELLLYGNFGNYKNLHKTIKQVKWGNTMRPIKYMSIFPRDAFDRLLFNIWLRCRKVSRML